MATAQLTAPADNTPAPLANLPEAMVVADDDAMDEEEAPESFRHITELRAHGVQQADITKLQKAGLHSVEQIVTAPTRMMTNIKGLSSDRIAFIREKSLVVDPASRITFRSALEVKEVREATPKITTGSDALDRLIGGGIESGTITEIYGDS
eukprot:CAMPEP_0119293416 /NCGR_PEP_ID=MMETSP1329-20130426/46054_1 /TAXON_ID=114041 /ORGANISM="Genus nov. species nov., Strain RCC1024" /LENGTH=151 /DNA_ID=CAMNT_0007294285 /DNA_START=49 /DNA_END=501 /DNA_ORIENTATION=+